MGCEEKDICNPSQSLGPGWNTTNPTEEVSTKVDELVSQSVSHFALSVACLVVESALQDVVGLVMTKMSQSLRADDSSSSHVVASMDPLVSILEEHESHPSGPTPDPTSPSATSNRVGKLKSFGSWFQQRSKSLHHVPKPWKRWRSSSSSTSSSTRAHAPHLEEVGTGSNRALPPVPIQEEEGEQGDPALDINPQGIAAGTANGDAFPEDHHLLATDMEHLSPGTAFMPDDDDDDDRAASEFSRSNHGTARSKMDFSTSIEHVKSVSSIDVYRRVYY